jgi:hypothetical protein
MSSACMVVAVSCVKARSEDMACRRSSELFTSHTCYTNVTRHEGPHPDALHAWWGAASKVVTQVEHIVRGGIWRCYTNGDIVRGNIRRCYTNGTHGEGRHLEVLHKCNRWWGATSRGITQIEHMVRAASGGVTQMEHMGVRGIRLKFGRQNVLFYLSNAHAYDNSTLL